MELNSLIPKKYKHLDKWKIKSDTLLFKNYQYIPLCFISDDNIVYVYLDLRLKKQVIEITKHLLNLKADFYFTIPDISDPSGVYDFEEKVIRHYLIMYTNLYFHSNFNKINFDLIMNMVKWSNKHNCYDLIKENFDIVLKRIQYSYYDYWTNKNIYEYSENIRTEFQTLYRQIQINQLLD